MIIDYNGLMTMALLVGVAAMAMDNVEDIENYDITQGYPEKLNLMAS